MNQNQRYSMLHLALCISVFAALIIQGIMGFHPANARPAASEALWQPVLDGLFGDRVMDLAFVGRPDQSARHLLLLPDDRGLYRSFNGELPWQLLEVDPERPEAVVLAVEKARDDEDGQTFYAGLRGRPLFSLSENGGQTWLTKPGPDEAGLGRLDKLASAQSGRIYVTTSDAGKIWTSVDQGDNWTGHDLSAQGINGRILDIITAPDDPFVYMLVGESLYRSEDDASNWTEVIGPTTTPKLFVNAAAIGPRGRLYAAGRQVRGSDESAHLYSSDDRGDNWPTGGWPAADSVAGTALEASETIALVPQIYMTLADGVTMRSENGGQLWQRVRGLQTVPTLVRVDTGSQSIWIGSDGIGLIRISPSLLRTGAIPVEALGLSAPTYDQDEQVYLNARINAEFNPPGEDLHAIFKSSGGQTWSRVLLENDLGDNLIASPAFSTDRRFFSGMKRSADRGNSWETVGLSPFGRPPYVKAVGPITGTAPVIFALDQPYRDGQFGSGAGLVRSENNGLSWVMADTDVTGIVDIAISPAYTEDLTVFFGTDRGIIFIAEDGLSFRQIGRIPAFSPQRSLYHLILSPQFRTDRTLLAAVEDPAGSSPAAVFISTNAGQNWNLRAGSLPDTARPRRLVLSPNFSSDRIAFLGGARKQTDGPRQAFFSSTTAGTDWFLEGELPRSAEVMDMIWGGDLADGKIFAAAGSAGVWMRSLSGVPVPTETPLTTATTTPTATQSATATGSASPTPNTGTPSPSLTPDPSVDTPTPTIDPGSATATISPTATATPTADPPSATPTGSASPTLSPSPPPPSSTPGSGGDICGTVYEFSDLSPRPGVMIQLTKDGADPIQTQTDIQGAYCFSGLEDGLYTLRTMDDNCDNRTEIVVYGGMPEQVDFLLQCRDHRIYLPSAARP